MLRKKLKRFSKKYTYKFKFSDSGYYMITQESHGTILWPFRIVYIINYSPTILCLKIGKFFKHFTF